MSEPQNPVTPGALRLSTSSAVVMTLFTVVFTALMAGTYLATRDTIAHSADKEKLRLINEVLDPASYDNDLLADALPLAAAPELGQPAGTQIWRARKGGQPVALVMEVVAPDGYAGRIELVVAVLADGRSGGVRVTRHHETPGLGDYIDPAKDKNKTAPWIEQFRNRSLSEHPLARWRVARDGGDIAYRAGATISARAVTGAVARALDFATQNRTRLFATEARP